MHKIIVAGVVLLTGCSSQALNNLGVPSDQAIKIVTITRQLAASGQLFCTFAGRLYQAGAVKVTNATANSVAQACAALTIADETVRATPTPAVAGQTALMATVPAPLAAAVHAP